jgi:UDP-N-acetylglucosamine transferase subunit ALG13
LIFLTVGSQKFQFDRLLKEVDKLVQEQKISDQIVGQIGYSNYLPQYFEYQKFMEHSVFEQTLKKSELVITHGGSGAIINALKMKKKVIAIPRLSQFKEHVDDHQKEIIALFQQQNYIKAVLDVHELHQAIDTIHQQTFETFESNTEKIIAEIDGFIQEQ